MNDLPCILGKTSNCDPIVPPNGSLLNSLFYADDLVILSTSATGLQKIINALHSYSQNGFLDVNLKKIKTVIFQKQCRKSTMEKYSFYLNDSQISNASNYTYLGSTISSNGSFGLSKQIAAEKTRRCIFNTKKYLDFYKLPITICNK